MKSSRFKACTEFIADVNLRVKRGDRILRGFGNNLFQKISKLPGVLCGVLVVKKSGMAKTWTAFGFAKQDHLSSQVTELENLSYHCYDRRNSSRLSIANALATSSSYLITSAMKLDKCKKAGEFIELVLVFKNIFQF